MDLSVVDTTLRDSPDLVIHRIEILAGISLLFASTKQEN